MLKGMLQQNNCVSFEDYVPQMSFPLFNFFICIKTMSHQIYWHDEQRMRDTERDVWNIHSFIYLHFVIYI